MIRTAMTVSLLAWASGASAADKSPARTTPDAFRSVMDCRALPDPQARLACYDAATGALNSAVRQQDVVIVDSAQIRATKRRLFGLFGSDGPSYPGAKAADAAPLSSVTARARSVSVDAAGQLFVVLEDGARWQQTDDTFVPGRFGANSTVVIKRAALGSYKMSIDGHVGVRARRVG